MATDHELQLVAAAVAALREDWPARSVLAHLRRDPKLRDRPYRHLVVAAVVVAVDPTSKTPGRLTEFGPWWQAAAASTAEPTSTAGPGRDAVRCDRPGHEYEAAETCRACAAERLAGTEPPSPPAHPVPAPPEVVAVANRHRTRVAAPLPSATGRDFAQPRELLQPTNDVRGCDSCGAMYVPGPDGERAHQVVFGHSPTRKELAS